MDFFGAAMTLAGSTLLILGLTWAGTEYAWDSVEVVVTIVLGVGVSIGFLMWQGWGAK